MAAGLINDGEYKALTKRGITEETCRKFGYQVAKTQSGDTVQIAPYFRADGTLVGQKVRPKSKEDMFVAGTIKGTLLFGQQLWASGGRMVVVTEGEIDAMSVSQVQGNKWPVVSVPNGAQGAKSAIAKHIEWLNTFETVVLMFDMDEPGREASAACAQLFQPGKCKIAALTMKDPNELLQAGKGDEIVQAVWQAKAYRPDGVVKMADIRESILTAPTMGISWFSETLTNATYGRRYGEVYTFGAGTGIGKTDFLTQQIEHDVNVLGLKVGLFMLEQPPDETAKRVAGKFAGKCFHVPDDGWTQDELIAVIDRLEREDKIAFYDNFGSTEWDSIASTIRYLVHSEDIRVFYVDHLTALADPENERESVEKTMKAIAMLANELKIIIHLVSHLSTPSEGKPHEEGGRVMIKHFKGSRSIGYWSHYMFGLERDQHHEDERWRVITTFRVLKDRKTGRSTGKVIYLGYEQSTGRLFETQAPEADDAHGFKDETQGSSNSDF